MLSLLLAFPLGTASPSTPVSPSHVKKKLMTSVLAQTIKNTWLFCMMTLYTRSSNLKLSTIPLKTNWNISYLKSVLVDYEDYDVGALSDSELIEDR